MPKPPISGPAQRGLRLAALLICLPPCTRADAIPIATTAGTYNGPVIFQLGNVQAHLISGTLVIGNDGSIDISGDNVVVTNPTGALPIGVEAPIGSGGGSLDLGSDGNPILGGGSASASGASLSLSGGSLTLNSGGTGGSSKTGSPITVLSGNAQAVGGTPLPSGGTVGLLKTGGPITIASGSAQVVGGTLLLQNVPGTIINWQQFSISPSEYVQFAHGGGGAVVLNRVMQSNPAISGSLSADGKVWLVSSGAILLARAGSGAIEPAGTMASAETAGASGGSALTAVGTLPHGAHGRPLQYRAAAGLRTAWVAGDLGRDDHGARDGRLALGEIGIGYNFGSFQINAAFGQTRTRQSTGLGGHTHTDGNYLLVEALAALSDRADGAGPWLTLDLFGHRGDADIRRGYLNLGLPDSSVGRPDSFTWGLRARVDWEDAATFGGFVLGPYADLGYAQMRMDGYTEAGGGFPARFDTRRERQSEIRLGAVAARPIAGTAQFLTQMELAHRFQDRGAATSGEIVGMFGFDQPGRALKQDWLRVGAGIEGRLAGGKGALMLNLSSEGSAPNAWLAASYRIDF